MLSQLTQEGGSIAAPTEALPKAGDFMQVLLCADASERQSLLETHLQAEVALVLGLDKSQLDLRRPLDTLGLDSIIAVELKNRIEGGIGVSLPIVDLLKGLTLTELAAQLLRKLSANVE
jgi:acyl carrier protein